MTTASTLTGKSTEDAPVVRTDRSKLIGGIAQAVIGLYGLWAFGLGSRTSHNAHTLFNLKLDPASSGPSPISAPAEPVAIALASIAIVCGLVRAFAPISAKVQRWLAVGYFASFVLAFLVWAAAGSGIGLNVPSIIQQTSIAAVPLILGSLSALLCERSGVVNIAVEGQFLFGAFAAVITASMTHSVWAGLVAGCLGGALMCALLAVFANRYLIEQVVLGVVLNLLASGVTGFLYDRLMSTDGATYNSPPSFNSIAIPGLSKIPVIGEALFNQNILFYAAYLLVPLVWFLLFRTRWGLRTRAVGEHPTAADTVGIKVVGLRYRNVITAGLLSGLGGVWLTLGLASQFGKDMSDGKGYIAIAALIVGRWSPIGSLGAAVLFGFATELNLALSSLGTPIPTAFLSMAPYLVTIFVVAALGGLARPPAASGKPYLKG
ncbi:ABC transporter permease [Streptacidiphilus carbonis]|jgi:general nucleoside transport system permease protein|uniref:ABC transporter permease n=1 Tax=Streptacidiphilus carbonis TaxID=105422 RepID=UPI0005AA1944|nr:ABC transporter permease [Streptacidiphilus carbonis]